MGVGGRDKIKPRGANPTATLVRMLRWPCIVLVFVSACSSGTIDSKRDGGADGATDAASDGRVDASPDASHDASPDGSADAGDAGPAVKPNILLISIDDLNMFVGSLSSHPNVQTPVLR